MYGTDFLSKVGINIKYEKGFMEWYKYMLLLIYPFSLDSKSFNNMKDAMFVQTEDEVFGDDWLDSFVTKMLNAKYDKTDVKDIVKQQTHMSANHQKYFVELLEKFSKLFSDKLDSYPHKQLHVNIDPDATPVHARAYPVPCIDMFPS